MATLHACCFVIAALLTSFALPSLQLNPSRRLLSLQLHLQPPPVNLHNATLLQPLTPYFFADQGLSHVDENSQAHINVGSAHGLYLADPAASMELRYVFFTATLRNHQGGESASKEVEEGSLVFMGSLGSGAISVVGGTGDFACASGQAQVSMAAADSVPEQLIVFLEVELQYEEADRAVE